MNKNIISYLIIGTFLLASVAAQATSPGRFLAEEDIKVLGLGLRAEPANQTVPKNIATVVSVFLGAETLPSGVPPFSPGAEVRATLRGPGLPQPIELVTRPNTPFDIPPVAVAGLHTLDNIRLVANGSVLMRANPESVRINVIDELLITQVTARPLSAEEIREKGIVFDSSNFQAFNFTTAFAIEDQTVQLDYPIVLPLTEKVQNTTVDVVGLPDVGLPSPPKLETLLPDTLKIQRQVPNLSVTGFLLNVVGNESEQLLVPPIPGVVVIPGDIGFLNQFFSVMLMVGNAAPDGSNLAVRDVRAEIVLPSGKDKVVGTPDDPLAMAQTTDGESSRIQSVVQPGPDEKLGTVDDIVTLDPGENGNAEYLVEGRREGSHVVEMEISATLLGLPSGSLSIRGRAAGSVLVRNPNFSLAFTHPEVVTAGEAYTLDVMITNTSSAPANFVSMNLYPRNVSGAKVIGEPTQDIESISPGESAAVSFDLLSKVTGKVTAATLDADENVSGQFALKSAVGELGVPLSPDSLILPKEASSLPLGLRKAAIALLGKTWAVATAPPAARPLDLPRFSRQIVFDRAVQVAEAGFRINLHEPVADSAAQLYMDFLGSDFTRLNGLKSPSELEFEQTNFVGFDTVRRLSKTGGQFSQAVGDLLSDNLSRDGPQSFHHDLSQLWSYRPSHISILASASSGPIPVSVSLSDSQIRRLDFEENSEVPFSGRLPLGESAQMLVVSNVNEGPYRVRLEPSASGNFNISLVYPETNGDLTQVVYQNLTSASLPEAITRAGESEPFIIFELDGGLTTQSPSTTVSILDPLPTVIGVIQQAKADVVGCGDNLELGIPVGRIVAVLFSEEVTPESVQDRFPNGAITHFKPEENRVVGANLQPGRRIVFLALRDPIGPFIPRSLTVSSVQDRKGQTMSSITLPMETTIGVKGGVISGRILQADGTPIPFADIRLFSASPCGPGWVGISQKSANEQGEYQWDYVNNELLARIVASDVIGSDEFRDIKFNIQRDGQRLNVDIILLGRGSIRGFVRSEEGETVPQTAFRFTSLTDQSQYSVVSDRNGEYFMGRVPVGNVFVEVVPPKGPKTTFTEYIPFSGAVIDHNITLLDPDTPVTVTTGTLTGHLLRNGNVPAANLPVSVFYKNNSQEGVFCSLNPAQAPPECAVAVGETDETGAFLFEEIPSGELRVYVVDQANFQEGEAGVVLPANGNADVTVYLAGGLGIVRGIVLDANGVPISNVRVGGGLSLTTTNADGRFVLTDVPVGRTTLQAVSDLLGTQGIASITIGQNGEEVNATIVLDPIGEVAGRVFQFDGIIPVSGRKVFLFYETFVNGQPSINIVASGITDSNGSYRFRQIPIREERYKISSFSPGFTDGNVADVDLKFQGQVVSQDIIYRGGGGTVSGQVFTSSATGSGRTPLKSRVGVSGFRPKIAGSEVGVGFEWVPNFAVMDTGFDGLFSFSGLWVGDFTISAVGQFSPDPVSGNGKITTPRESVNADLELQPTGRIQGIVFSPDGVTPAGENLLVRFKSDAVKVVCSGESCTTTPQGIQEENVVTNADGEFLIPLVNAGPYTITVEDSVTGKTGQMQGLLRAGEEGKAIVKLLGLNTLVVDVKGSDAVTPISGAQVTVIQLAFPKEERTFTADASGRVIFSGGDAFSEGEVVIEAVNTSNGFAGRGSVVLEGDEQEITTQVFLFDSAGTIIGSVVQSDGVTPVSFSDVMISNDSGPLAFGITDASGTFQVGMIPLGDFTVDVFVPASARRGFAAGRIDFNGQEVPITVRENALGLVTGRVLNGFDLSPLKGWGVNIEQKNPAGRTLDNLIGTSGVNGEFSFPGVLEGSFVLRVNGFSPGFGFKQLEGAVTREGEVVDVPVIVDVEREVTGRVQGVVRNSNGVPVPNSRVEVCYSSSFLCLEPSFVVTSDANGGYLAENVPLGRFHVRAADQILPNVGSSVGKIEFENETVDLDIVLAGLATVSGVVENANGTPAGFARLRLFGEPSSGCDDFCEIFADADGLFTFNNIPARTFTLLAEDSISELMGSVGGTLNEGDSLNVRVVLEPTAFLRGQVLLANGGPGSGIVAELQLTPSGGGDPISLFRETEANGTFEFPAVPFGIYELVLQDPIGPGLMRRSGQIIEGIDLGQIILDEAPPLVIASEPSDNAVGVALDSVIRISFSEQIDPGTFISDNVTLMNSDGIVPATFVVVDGDRVGEIRPLSNLDDEERYTIRVKNIEDILGKIMPVDYVGDFTTVDVTAPLLVSASPLENGSGVPLESVVRLAFNEPFNSENINNNALVIRKQGGDIIEGQVEPILGNTALVFTPAFPLEADTIYEVRQEPVVDLAGNPQAAPLVYLFSTTDGTPPVLVSLTAEEGNIVIENTIAHIIADPGVVHDVALVDFFVNDILTATDRAPPFEMAFRVDSSAGSPGDSIQISARAVDTSGNRQVSPTLLELSIQNDLPPTLLFVSPADGTDVHTGDFVSVTLQSNDEVGLVEVAFSPETGRPLDSQTITLDPLTLSSINTFSFNIPNDSEPGSTLIIRGAVLDNAGHLVESSIGLHVLDAEAPDVQITGLTSGQQLVAGTSATVVVAAQDLGFISSVELIASGAASSFEVKTLSLPQKNVAVAFTFFVPLTARPGENVTLTALAQDVANNEKLSDVLILPVADNEVPIVRLRTQTGLNTVARGRDAELIVEADDEVGVTRIDIEGSGAFIYSDSRSISPPLSSTQTLFSVLVPDSVPEGSLWTVQTRAVDIAGNISLWTSIDLSVVSLIEVTLPPSVILFAGETVEIPVSLSSPAPSDGLRLDFVSENVEIISVDPSLTFEAGQSSGTISVTGLGDGSTSIVASINGVERTRMTTTIRGGVVSGIVRNELFEPVAGVQMTIKAGLTFLNQTATTVTDTDGFYRVDGLFGPRVSVSAFDPIFRLRGHATGEMTKSLGFADVSLILVPAGVIRGTVFLADEVTPAGEGSEMILFESDDLNTPVGTSVFTSSTGAYEFPLVSLGDYVVEARDSSGNRGRTSASLVASGDEVTADVSYLARGAVVGTIRNGAGDPVPNAALRLFARNIFGFQDPIIMSAQVDGTFRFENIFAGEITLEAVDPITDQAGLIEGTLVSDGQELVLDVALASFGIVRGIVTRPDGLTPVSGADVTLISRGRRLLTLLSNPDGSYAFPVVPLGDYAVSVRDTSSRGLGRRDGDLGLNGEEQVVNVSLLPQGSLLVTVETFDGNPVPGSRVVIVVENGELIDGLNGETGADGTILLERLMVGNFTISAAALPLTGVATGVLSADVVFPVTVSLDPTASISGTVYRPDGMTPAVNVRIETNLSRSDITDGSGNYRIDGLPLALHSLNVYDEFDHLRFRNPLFSLETPGDVLAMDITMIPLGTVTGRVINPNSSGAPGILVEFQSNTPHFNVPRGVFTDGAGFFTFNDVPGGTFTVSAGDRDRQLLGESEGAITVEGETVTVDVILQNNGVTPPVTLYDGNNAHFRLTADGSVNQGIWQQFSDGAFILEISSGNQVHRFSGGSIATKELSEQQIVFREDNIFGLNVTRKVFVPQSGYFARYLETFANPTTNPITVDLRVRSHIGRALSFLEDYSIINDSSGDSILSVSSDTSSTDRWVTLDDNRDEDPYLGPALDPARTSSLPALSFVFDGEEALTRVSKAQYDIYPSSQVVSWSWDSVTLAPGETLSFLHYTSQQMNRDSALATAERLVQMPPEALTGLSLNELSWVQNFNLPEDGMGTLESLPPMGGILTGTVFEVDTVTPVPGTPALFTSQNILFQRTYVTETDGTGAFRFDSTVTDRSVFQPMSILAGDFDVKALHYVSDVLSSSTIGQFESISQTASENVFFTNTAMVKGFVRRHTGALVTNPGTLTITNDDPFFHPTLPISGGQYTAPGLSSGTYTLTVEIPSSQGTHSQASITVSVNEGEILEQDIVLNPTGSVSGQVRGGTGDPAVDERVILLSTGFNRETRTDSSGAFLFPEVPVGDYTVRAFESQLNQNRSVNVSVTVGSNTITDLTLPAVATLNILVRDAEIPVSNVRVEAESLTNGFSTGFGFTNLEGRLSLLAAEGEMLIDAGSPSSIAQGQILLAVLPGDDGSVIPVTIDLLREGIGLISYEDEWDVFAVQLSTGDEIRATVNGILHEGQSAISDPFVRFSRPNGNFLRQERVSLLETVDQSGLFVISVRGGLGDQLGGYRLNLRVNNFLVVPSSYPGGVAQGTVMEADGVTPLAGARVNLETLLFPFNTNVLTNLAGFYQINNVPVTGQEFTVSLMDSSGFVLNSATGTLADVSDVEVIDLIVPGEATLVVTVRDILGNPMPGLNANLISAGPFQSGVTDADGQVQFVDVLEGPYSVDIRSPDFSGIAFIEGAILSEDRGTVVQSEATFYRPTQDALSYEGERDLFTLSANRFDRISFLIEPLEEDGALSDLRDAQVEVYNPDGSFLLEDNNLSSRTLLQDGNYTFVVKSFSGIQTGGYRLTIFFNGDNFQLSPFIGGTVRGQAVGDDGVSPVIETRVNLVSSGGPVLNTNTLTDFDGQYEILNVPFDPWGSFSVSLLDSSGTVLASTGGVVGSSSDVVMVDLRLPTFGTVTARTVYEDGMPRSGIEVFLSGGDIPSVSGVTGTDGRFIFDSVQTGKLFTLQSTHPVTGELIQSAEQSLSSLGENRQIDLTIGGFSTLNVQLLAPGGSPYPNATVELQDSLDPIFKSQGITNASGLLSILQVPEGSFALRFIELGGPTVVALSSGSLTSSEDGQIVDVVVEAAPLVSLTGVTFAGDGSTPVPNVFVEVFDRVTGIPLAQGFVDSSSSYLFDVPQEAEVTVRASVRGETAEVHGTPVAGGSTLNMTLPLSVIRGRVFFADGSTPAPHPLVSVQQGLGEFPSILSEADGSYAVVGVDVGIFSLQTEGGVGLSQSVPGTIVDIFTPVIIDVVLPEGASLSGTVLFARGISAPNALVFIGDLGKEPKILAELQTDSEGLFSFPQVLTDTNFVLVVGHPDNEEINTQRDIFLSTGSHTENMNLPAVASVDALALDSSDLPLIDAPVFLQDNLRIFEEQIGMTDAFGRIFVTAIPEGDFTLQVPGKTISLATGTVSFSDDGNTLLATLRPPPFGDVTGVVLVADGTTIVPQVNVNARDADTDEFLGSFFTGDDGVYTFTNLKPSAGRVAMSAFSPIDGVTLYENIGQFTSSGELLNIDITMPLGVVKGTVTFSDESPVPFPNVFLTQGADSFFSHTSNGVGEFLVLTNTMGNYILTATDHSSGAVSESTGTLSDLLIPEIVNVTMPPVGKISGQIFTHLGDTITDGGASLLFPTNDILLSSPLESSGTYSFNSVVLGTVTIQGCQREATLLQACRKIDLIHASTDTHFDLILPATGTLSGTVFDQDGMTPIPNARVTVADIENNGPTGNIEKLVLADSLGFYQLDSFPEGSVSVLGNLINNFVGGLSIGQVFSTTTTNIDVVFGNALFFNYPLLDTNGFQYDVSCGGALFRGGKPSDPSIGQPYSFIHRLLVNGRNLPCFKYATPDENVREAVLGPASLQGLEVTRKIFVPDTGAFARFLEIFTNNSAEDVTVNVELTGFLNFSSGILRLLSEEDGYKVTDQGGGTDATLAHVFTGPGASSTPTVSIQDGRNNIQYEIDMTIPAGETRIFMHFAVQRNPGDAAGAETQAQSLRSLTDVNAAIGLSIEEKSEVINFIVP